MPHRDLRVVVLNSHGHWSASFDDAIECGYGGATPREAAQRLLRASARVDLETEKALEIAARKAMVAWTW